MSTVTTTTATTNINKTDADSTSFMNETTSFSNVQNRIYELENRLAAAKQELEELKHPKVSFNKITYNGDTTSIANESSTPKTAKEPKVISPIPENAGHPGKRGYLFKWRDRAIGWGGTKWELRFVVLEQGRLAYYRTHRDIAPRYVLVLNRCAVRDEGIKYKKSWTDSPVLLSNNPSKDTTGDDRNDDYNNSMKKFHVFSVYQRPKYKQDFGRQTSAEADEESEITPLLRFSTESRAEKMLWIDFISEACAYCASESFLLSQNNGDVIVDQLPAAPLLQLEPGKLPPIYFGKPRLMKLKSNTKSREKGKLYRRKSNSERVTHLRSTYPPSRPMHKSANPSYLSAESESQNFRGLLNLALIMLLVSHFNILLHIIKTQGFFLTKIPNIPVKEFVESPLEQFPFFTGLLLLPLFVLYAYMIEVKLSDQSISENLGMGLHWINSIISAVVPLVIVWCFIPNPFMGAILSMTSTITWMKLVSYALANCDYRISKQDSYQATLALISDLEEGASDLSYPFNVTLSNIMYFWFAPTLTYQMAYPRSPKIRWTKILGILPRLVVAMAMLLFLCAQVLVPNLDILTEEYRKHGKFDLSAEYLTNLALASTYTWLLFFYTYFHLMLNLLAELLRFGDRVFYKDWWNASEVSSYWRLWNAPVHYWLIRHVYFPCIRMRMSKNAATFVVFFVSAVIHEVLISVPFHMVSYWSFFGMMGQLPLITFTKFFDSKFQGSSIGNVIFWLSFCVVGQPTAILLYAIDFWDKEHAGNGVGNNFVESGVGANIALNATCIGSECEL